jgi:hypothetical protein
MPRMIEGRDINRYQQTNANDNVVSLDAFRKARKSFVEVLPMAA